MSERTVYAQEVRRGSTVRVRQRALQSAAHRCFLVQADWLVVERAVVWSR